MEYLHTMTLDTFHPCNTRMSCHIIGKLVQFQDFNMETQKRTLNISEPYSVISIVVAITIVVLSPLSFPLLFLAVYNVGIILAEAPSYSLWTSC